MDNRILSVIKKKNNKFRTQSIMLQPLKGKKYEYAETQILFVEALKSRQKRTEIVKIRTSEILYLWITEKKSNKFGTPSITLQPLKAKKYEYPKTQRILVEAQKSRQKRMEMVKI